jgi:flagellar motor switch protein FliM
MEGLDGRAVLEIDPAITHTMIDRLFGGNGEIKQQHELTPLEMKIMEDVINDNVLGPLHSAWDKIVELKPVLERLDTNPQFSQIVPPPEMTVLVTMECRIGDTEGMVNICYPYLTISSILNRLTAQFWYSGVEKKPDRLPLETTLNEVLDKVNIPIRVELGKKNLPLKELKEMGEGTILELDKLTGEPVDIYAGEELVGYGEVVVIDENFGVRVVEVVGGKNG